MIAQDMRPQVPCSGKQDQCRKDKGNAMSYALSHAIHYWNDYKYIGLFCICKNMRKGLCFFYADCENMFIQ